MVVTENVRVVVRIRPLNRREQANDDVVAVQPVSDSALQVTLSKHVSPCV